MGYMDIINAMKRYGSSEREIVLNGIGVAPETISENVIIAPWWEPRHFPVWQNAKPVQEAEIDAVRIWNIRTQAGGELTYIKTGIGAPVFMDVLLCLGLTPCKRILFWGSVGALDRAMEIGDVAIPEYSVCGDGASRYLIGGSIAANDPFGKKEYPDAQFNARLQRVAERLCGGAGVALHGSRNFSIDTIAAQFGHLDEIIAMGCNTVEMETASAFAAARLMNIPLAAVFSVSDNTVAGKSLISGRTEEERARRRSIRAQLFPQIAQELFFNDR